MDFCLILWQKINKKTDLFRKVLNIWKSLETKKIKIKRNENCSFRKNYGRRNN